MIPNKYLGIFIFTHKRPPYIHKKGCILQLSYFDQQVSRFRRPGQVRGRDFFLLTGSRNNNSKQVTNIAAKQGRAKSSTHIMKLKDRPTPGLIDSAQFKSRHNVNDPVIIYFGNSGIIKNCKVIKIHFTESTVSYDVEVKWTHEDQEYENTDRLYNLHSSIVFNPNDFEQS